MNKDAKEFSNSHQVVYFIFLFVYWVMTLEEFNRIPHFEHEIIVHEEAVFMDMSRRHEEYYVFQYSMEHFFIEAFVYPETGNGAKYKGVKDANA